MTSIGRGRGIIMRRDAAPPQLRRPLVDIIPTQSLDAWQVPLDILLAKVAVLDDNDGFVLNNIRKEIVNFCSSLERLEKFLECIHERALDDRSFGHRAAVAICTTSLLVVDGHKLRNSLITHLQHDYTNSLELQATNPARFLNAVAFLGEIIKFVRLASSRPISVLLMALMDYQTRLVLGNDAEVELCINMLALNCRTLVQNCMDHLEPLMIKICTRALSNALSSTSRSWLLLALHIHCSNYQPIAGAFQYLYEERLSKASVTRINVLMALPDSLPVERMDEAALDKLRDLTVSSAKSTSQASPAAASAGAAGAALPSSPVLDTGLPSPNGLGDGFPSPNAAVSPREPDAASGQQPRARREGRSPGAGGRTPDDGGGGNDWREESGSSWGGRPKDGGSDWGKRDGEDRGKIDGGGDRAKGDWGGQNRGGGNQKDGKWGAQREDKEKAGGWGGGGGGAREERKERGSWSGGDREEKERGNWGVREGGRRPRDDRNDSSTWLSKPTPSQKDIEAWGLRPARGSRGYGHDDRFDVDYDGKAPDSAENWG